VESSDARAATIVGAGAGSLSLAALLAKDGWNVRVFERAAGPGGKACVRHEAGFVYDEGPSILILREVYDGFFARLGLAREDVLAFDDLDPAFRIVGADGSDFFLHADFSATLRSVRHGLRTAGGVTAERAARELEELVTSLDTFARVIGLSFADRAVSSWLDFARPRLALSGLFVSPFAKYKSFIDARLSHPLLREFFYGFPGYAGYHPAEAPASLVLLPWQILRRGVFYPRGGVGAIVRAMEEAGRSLGVTFHYGVTVDAFERTASHKEQGAICALKTSAGRVEIAPGEQVIFGGCLGWLASDEGAPEMVASDVREKWRAQSPSFFTVQTGMDARVRAQWNLAHHTLLLPIKPEQSYQDYFQPGATNPVDPPLYLNIPSVTDRTVAPDGFDNLFLVVSVPSRERGAGLDAAHADSPAHPEDALEEAHTYARACLTRVRGYFPGLPASAFDGAPFHVKETARFETELLQKGGQIYGPSLRTAQRFAGFARPHPRSRAVSNLWFVGGGTQPGAGLPMVVQSGRIVAQALNAAFSVLP